MWKSVNHFKLYIFFILMSPFRILDSVPFNDIYTIYNVLHVYVKILIISIYPMLMLGIIKVTICIHCQKSKWGLRWWLVQVRVFAAHAFGLEIAFPPLTGKLVHVKIYNWSSVRHGGGRVGKSLGLVDQLFQFHGETVDQVHKKEKDRERQPINSSNFCSVYSAHRVHMLTHIQVPYI